jgi:anthranilate phosphoribosyltransferase
VREETLDPERLGIPRAHADDLRGGDAAANAAIVREVLGGVHGPRRDIVAVNAAGALWAAGVAADLREGLGLATASIDSGAARARLEALVRASQSAETA